MSATMEKEEFESKWRQVRACARCHRLKMRCSYSDPTVKACKRCFSIGVECSPDEDPTAQFARKKRKLRAATTKSTTPVAGVTTSIGSEASGPTSVTADSPPGTLMKHLRTLVDSVHETLALFEGSKRIPDDVPESLQNLQILKQNILSAYLKVSTLVSTTATNSSTTLENGSSIEFLKYPQIPYSHNIAKELIYTHKRVSLDECKKRFEFFMNEMLPYYPVISFSKRLRNFQYLLDKFPLLLLSCISVTTIHHNGFLSTPVDNRNLQVLLNYYLERFLSHRIYIQADGFTIQLIQICIILSVWSPPPNKLGHFKNLVNLLLSLNVSLCIGLGDETAKTYPSGSSVADDDSEERNDLRTFLSVYCNCGSLGLSLYRFKLVNWSHNHDLAISKLEQHPKSSSRGDKYLICYAKAIKLSQEIYQVMSIDSGKQTSQTMSTKNESKAPTSQNLAISLIGGDPSTLPVDKLTFLAQNYEIQFFNLLKDSGFIESGCREASLFAILYYQVSLAMYDKLLHIHLNEKHLKHPLLLQQPEEYYITYINLISKLVTLCENILNSYIELNEKQTVNYPTFVYYRPMHSLVLLIRLKLLSKSQVSNIPNQSSIKINVEFYFEKISTIISNNQKMYNLGICQAMNEILIKIQKWIKVSEEYTSSPLPVGPEANNLKATRSSLLIDLMERSKHQEIESLEIPHEMTNDNNVDLESKTKRRKTKESKPLITETLPTRSILNPNENIPSAPIALTGPDLDLSLGSGTGPSLGAGVGTSSMRTHAQVSPSAPAHSIQEIFQEIDTDIMNYLNLLESNSNSRTGDIFNSINTPFFENNSTDPLPLNPDSYFANFFSNADENTNDNVNGSLNATNEKSFENFPF